MGIKNIIVNKKGLNKEEAANVVLKAIVKKIMEGKQLADFDEEDWKDIIAVAGYDVNVEEIAKTVSNLLNGTPIEIKEQLGIIRILVLEQVKKFRAGEISELEFIETCELICLEGTVRAISNTIGNFDIKLPILGAIIEDTNCEALYKIARQYMNEYEQQVIDSYIEHFRVIETGLDEQYQKCLEAAHKEIDEYFDLLDEAFDTNPEKAFNGSMTLAEYFKLNDCDILKSKDEINNYFN